MGMITTNNKRQTVILHRWVWSIALYTIFFFIGLISIWVDILDTTYQHFIFTFTLVYLVHALLFCWVRFGYSDNFKDTGFVYYQIIFSFIVILYFMNYLEYYERITLLNASLMSLLFGIFVLKLRQLVVLASMPLLGAVYFVIRDYVKDEMVLDFQIEILQLVVTTILFGACAALGGSLSNLRFKLEKNRQQLFVQKEELEVTCRELESVFRQMSQKAVKDELTGLYNRHQFSEEFHSQISIAQASDKLLGLVIIDVDHFKNINDTYGHLVGDSVLKAFRQVSENLLEKSDFMARFGGEEFVILLHDTNEEKLVEACEKIKIFIENLSFYEAEKEFHITVSLGATIYRYREKPEQFLKRADENLYSAKKAGRNRLVFAH